MGCVEEQHPELLQVRGRAGVRLQGVSVPQQGFYRSKYVPRYEKGTTLLLSLQQQKAE